MADEPWYKDGLRFECNRCGDCCSVWPGFIWLKEADIVPLARYFDITEDEFKETYTHLQSVNRVLNKAKTGGCLFYNKDTGCTVQSAKPKQCRDYPFFPDAMQTEEGWLKLVNKCPGAGQGELIPAEEITRRLKLNSTA